MPGGNWRIFAVQREALLERAALTGGLRPGGPGWLRRPGGAKPAKRGIDQSESCPQRQFQPGPLQLMCGLRHPCGLHSIFCFLRVLHLDRSLYSVLTDSKNIYS